MRHHASALQRLASVAPADCAISSITTYELYTGIEKCADPAKELAKVNLLLATVSELVFDGQAARDAGGIRARLESQGCMIGAYPGRSRPDRISPEGTRIEYLRKGQGGRCMMCGQILQAEEPPRHIHHRVWRSR